MCFRSQHNSLLYFQRLTVNLWSYYTGNAGLQHPLPVSQVGSNNIQVRLHYIDGNYTVLPEVVEAALGPHMQVTFCFPISKSVFLADKQIHDFENKM